MEYQVYTTMTHPLTEENLRIHTNSLPRHSTISAVSISSKETPMEDADLVHTISGKDVIMAFGGTPKSYVQRNDTKGSSRCGCLFWSRYALFLINLIIWLGGLTLVGFGAWILVDGAGILLFKTLFLVPGILLASTGVVMVTVGICGWIGALRRYVMCLRVYMLLVMSVFVMQLATGAMAFFMLDTVEKDMIYHAEKAVRAYGNERHPADSDHELDKLQREFQCCGGTSLMDWDVNPYYNCTSKTYHQCGVPASCCRGSNDHDCGNDVRDGPLEETDRFVYTKGCVVSLMDFVKEHILIIAAIAFSISFLEVFSLILAGLVIKYTVYHKTLLEE